MKKILLVALMSASFGAFAQTAVQGQQQQTSSTSASVAAAQNAGNTQQITVAPVTTNYASDLKDQGATAAATTSAAAIKIAEIQAATAAAAIGANGTRDLSADQQRALDREAMLEAARIGQTVKNTPGIVLGQLVSSNDTCMGSVSVGGSGPGFSLGIGTTYTDDNCKLLKNSRELWNMGMKAASLALMCKNADNREALELTGFECPQTAKARKDSEAAAKKVAEATQPEVTDPIVRARLGLPELTASAK